MWYLKKIIIGQEATYYSTQNTSWTTDISKAHGFGEELEPDPSIIREIVGSATELFHTLGAEFEFTWVKRAGYLKSPRMSPSFCSYYPKLKRLDTGCWIPYGRSFRPKVGWEVNLEIKKINLYLYWFHKYKSKDTTSLNDYASMHKFKVTVMKNNYLFRTCTEAKCVAPNHHTIISISDFCKRKTPKGSANGRSKLTNKDAVDIYTSPLSIPVLAKHYEVDPTVIRRIKKRVSWVNATKDIP